MKDYKSQAEWAASIAIEAANLVSGNRQKDYGNKWDNHLNIAKMWNAYLGGKGVDTYLEPHDVALMMILLKMARTLTGDAFHKRDTYVDIVGYGAIAGVLARIEHDNSTRSYGDGPDSGECSESELQERGTKPFRFKPKTNKILS